MKNNNSFAAIARLGRLRIRPSKVLAVSLFVLALLAGSLTASAQNVTTITTGHIVHQVVKQTQNPPELGRDFWFAPIQNYIDQPGKYYRLYITSPNNTTAFVESQGVVKSIPVTSYGVGTYVMPLSWEMKSSCIVENKGIHVYDPTDDICVYMMSHNPYTSDGARIIPTTGWGTDYVVVAYEALFEGFGSYVFDEPSELSITASQDNTEVEVTPTMDCRISTQYPNGATTVGAPQGKVFEFTLNQGQSLQMQTVKATDADNYDLTGTIIHSNVGVDVMAGSVCPNIPPDFPYCDEICDQVPPVRAWAETYYTTNSAQPEGQPGHDFNLYCMVSSVPNQTIYRYNTNVGLITEGVLGPTYDHLYVEEEGPNKWFSDQPFLLFEYLNSSTYPDGNNGNGDPADCPITPKENFTKDVVFETPTSLGSQAPYDNYANIICNVNDIHNVTFDGKPITSLTHEPIDDTFTIYVVPHIVPAAHTVHSDSGCGVYIYGYGYDESYMWGGSFGNGTFHSPDTVPPNELITGACYQADVHVTDSGWLPGITPLTSQSGLNDIRLDTDINMAYLPDLYPNWVEGSPSTMDTSGYSMYVVDETKPAKLVVDIFDAAGNETTITSTYVPQLATIGVPLQNFGVVETGQPAACRYDTLTNLGQVPFAFDTLYLKYGNQGFTIDSIPASPIPVGKSEAVKICFYPIKQTAAVDTIIFGDACVVQGVGLIGSGGAPDFYVDDVIWQNVPLNPPANDKTATNPGGWISMSAVIHNLSATDTLHVINTGIGNTTNFALSGEPAKFANNTSTLPTSFTPQNFPITVPPNGTDSAWFFFEPTSTARTATWASWEAPKELDSTTGDMGPVVKYDSLIGNAITPTLTFTASDTVTLQCADTSIHSVTLSFLLSNTGSQDAVLNKVILSDPTDFTNLMAYDQHGFSWDPATQINDIPPGAVDTIKVTVPVNVQSNSSVTTQIVALDVNNDTIGGVVLTGMVNVNYWAYQINPPISPIPFGTYPYQHAKVGTPFTITNTTSSDLIIDSITFEQPGQYNTSYSFTTVPPLNGTTPDTLTAGQQMTVNMVFDPSVSFDSVQKATVQISSNACNPQNVNFTAGVTVSGAAASITPSSPILSCDNQTTTITITNPQPTDAAENENVSLLITSATLLSGGANFSIPNIVNQVISGNSSMTIPVTFTPNAGPQDMQAYTGQLQIQMSDTYGKWDTTMVIDLSGTASSIAISANSTFAANGGASSAAAGGTLNLPIIVTVDKNGLNVPLTQLNITEVDLTYNVQNPNLVTPGNMTPYAGWTSTPPAWNATTGVLSYKLTPTNGTSALDDNVTAAKNGLGLIPFQVFLDPNDDGSNITLTSMQLLSGGQPVGSCVATSVQSGSMSLILQCGDSTLRLLMSGNGNLINIVNPATPDPVTGGHVTFSYENRGATNITLSVLDVLGKEVMRPIDNVYHDAGAWQTTSDVSSLPSGTYTYRLSAGDNVISKQFVIQR